MIKEGGNGEVTNIQCAFFPLCALNYKTKPEDQKLEARHNLENASSLEFKVTWTRALSFFP